MIEPGRGVSVGWIDAHSHLRSTALAAHGVPSPSLEESLLRMNAMTAVDPSDDVFVATARMLESGVTGVQAMYHSFAPPEDYLAGLEAVVDGIRRSGIRALVILGITDQAEFLPPWTAEAVTLPGFVHQVRGMSGEQFGDVVEVARSRFPEVSIGVGPVGPQWCSERLLGQIAEVAGSNTRIHTHCLESSAQRSWVESDPVVRLETAGLLGPLTSLAHAVWITNDEVDRVVDHGAHLVTCPRSNQLLGSGRAAVAAWRSRSASIALGLDSAEAIPQPLVDAMMADPEEPRSLLTTGGHAATGLANDAHEVHWLDQASGVVDRVRIDGRVVVEGGRFVDRGALDNAQARITEAMERDAAARAVRQQELDTVMSDYLRAIQRGA